MLAELKLHWVNHTQACAAQQNKPQRYIVQSQAQHQMNKER
jgi:hypothetical protein